MDAQEYILRLVNMPELVLEKILANMHNPSNVARTCKYLYEFVCGMEKVRRRMYITASDAESSLNIDDDAVFNSIMNTHRPITKIQLRLDCLDYEEEDDDSDSVEDEDDEEDDTSYKFNELQLERMTAIIKLFGANITSLEIRGFVLPINFILELLQQATRLESLTFTDGYVMGSVSENATMQLQLTSLLVLEIIRFSNLFDIVNLMTAEWLSYIHYTDQAESMKVLETILTKQLNIKHLILEDFFCSDIIAPRFKHLQLETLICESCESFTDSRLVKFLKCQTTLKELRFRDDVGISESLFQWICSNLKNLEVFEVKQVDSIGGNILKMLGELKQLRHFHTYNGDYLLGNGFQLFRFKSDSIEQFEIGSLPKFSCGELLNKTVTLMTHNLPNLTHLKMKFRNFSALSFVLGHCTKIVHLTSYILNPIPAQLTHQRFPNIQTLELRQNDFCDSRYEAMMSQSMPSIVRAMPNLKSLSLSKLGLKFDVKTMKEFIKQSKSLEYFHVNRFEVNRKLSTDDVVETIRCLIDQLKGYHIIVGAASSPADLNWCKIKDILFKECYVRDDYWNNNLQCFCLYKKEEGEDIF